MSWEQAAFYSAELPRRRTERIVSCSRGSSDRQREQICHCQSVPAFCFPSLPLLRVCLLSPCVRRALRKLWVTAGLLPLEPSSITACNLRYGLLDYIVLCCCCCPLLSALFSVSVYRLTCWNEMLLPNSTRKRLLNTQVEAVQRG